MLSHSTAGLSCWEWPVIQRRYSETVFRDGAAETKKGVPARCKNIGEHALSVWAARQPYRGLSKN
jgi:hypothetical protein